ncbi:MAG: LapA family protein [Marmoricola sp.]
MTSDPRATPDPSGPAGATASSEPSRQLEPRKDRSNGKEPSDPLRGSRTSGVWVAAGVLSVLLVLLVIFIVQNTQSVEVSFLGWNGHAPLAAALLIGAVVGLAVSGIAGTLRIMQLRRRVKRLNR